MSKIIRLVDRTRTVQDWKCPRARYWGYEYEGRGLAKSSTSLALFTGIVLHDALAAIATFTKEGAEVPIDDIASLAFAQLKDELLKESAGVIDKESLDFANEQGTLIEGMIRGFYKHVWPRLMEKTRSIVSIEQEMEFNLDPSGHGGGFVFMAKPDLILEDFEGELSYIEYKSTSWKKDSWINSWETAVQVHSSIKATEATLGKAPSTVQIVGIYKGYESYGKQSSPFCYAYKKSGNPPFTQDQVQYEYKAGFKRFATWEMQGGVKSWVESMPENILANQFPMPAPIFVNDDLVEKFFKQRLIRERIIAEATTNGEYDDPITGIDAVFPQHFDQCQPSIGYSCDFKKLCHGFVANPLDEGFELRTPHHQRELEALNG